MKSKTQSAATLSQLLIIVQLLPVALIMSGSGSCSALQQVTFLRHGCTYMNEYLGGADGGKPFGEPGFTDVFAANNDDDPTTTSSRRLALYRDSPLSDYGRRQVKQLLSDNAIPPHDLVVVSPLQRALQTYHRGVRPHYERTTGSSSTPVVIALPLAAERLYLISDVGTEKSKLAKQYPYISFDLLPDDGNWWYEPTSDSDYSEWRATDQGQRYACPAEPKDVFTSRMQELLQWLTQRPEQHILVVCHHGVIESLLDEEFCNCEFKTVSIEELLENQ
jgi:Histidine phosphatase superfamily (branch 1)